MDKTDLTLAVCWRWYHFCMSNLIRNATPEDVPAIAHVHTQSWRETYTGRIPEEVLSQLTLERRLAQWQRYMEQGSKHVLVLEHEGQVVGFARAMPHPETTLGTASELESIYLLKAHQGKGAGRQLMTAAVQHLQDAGATTMGLWVLKDNPTIGFYERMGGVQTAENSMRWFGHDLPVIGYVWQDLGPILRG